MRTVRDTPIPEVHASVHAEEMPGVVPAVTTASSSHGPGSGAYHLEWTGRPWRSWPRIVEATVEERRCLKCGQTYPCEGFLRRASWPY